MKIRTALLSGWIPMAVAMAALLSPLSPAQAQDTPPAAPAPAAPAPAAAPAAPAAAPAPAAAAPATAAVEATLEMRINALEAYLQNTSPDAAFESLKVKKKNDEGVEESVYPEGFSQKTLGVAGPGHNAWMMTSAALVLFMTLPGLALFYGGLVRRKNVLSVLAQCLACAGLVSILWWAFGYSLVFGKSFESPFLGGSEFFFMKGVDSAPNTDYSYWVSNNVFSMYQMMFAIITPALIVGAIAERMKFAAIMTFIGAWMFLVYFPMAHMVWGVTGFMNGVWNKDAVIPAIDFAGGTVVHMTSGWSALVLCIILGKRLGFGRDKMAPHRIGTRRRRDRGQRLHHHDAGSRHRLLHLGAHGTRHARSRFDPGLLLRRGCRSGGHHPRLRFCRHDGRHGHRRACRGGALHLRDAPQGPLRL